MAVLTVLIGPWWRLAKRAAGGPWSRWETGEVWPYPLPISSISVIVRPCPRVVLGGKEEEAVGLVEEVPRGVDGLHRRPGVVDHRRVGVEEGGRRRREKQPSEEVVRIVFWCSIDDVDRRRRKSRPPIWAPQLALLDSDGSGGRGRKRRAA
jgi:hypothetical protein